MKTCTRCKKKKSLAKFGINKSKPDGLQGQCKTCRKKTAKEWYKRNKHSQRDRIKKLRAVRTAEKRTWIMKYFITHPCMDCGENDPIVLEFDHVSGTKNACVSKYISGTHSLEKMIEEVSKCEIVCANCHKRRTARRDSWWKAPEAQQDEYRIPTPEDAGSSPAGSATPRWSSGKTSG